jgi:hypothetical protein
MLRQTLAIALFATTLAPAVVSAQVTEVATAAAPTKAASGYTVAGTEIGTLLDDAASKAVLEKHLPGFSANPQIEMARGMTLKAIQGFAADILTDDVLGKIDTDLAALPAK